MTEELREKILHYLILYRAKEYTEKQTASKFLQAFNQWLGEQGAEHQVTQKYPLKPPIIYVPLRLEVE